MWRWQVKKQLENFYTNNSLLCKALAGASALHVLVLALFITGTKSSKDLHITIGKAMPHSASVVVMPLVKRVTQARTPLTQSKTIVKKKSAPVPIKNTTVVKAQTVAPKKVAQKPKPALKPVVPEKKVAAKKEPDKKPIVKNEPKKVELPRTEKPQEEVKRVATSDNVAPAISNNTANAKPESLIEEPVLVGYEQLEELKMQEYFEQEIAQKWSPPPGFAADTGCQVQLTISAQGVIEKITIKKSSGSLAYDTSVRMAVGTLTVPKWAYNRSVHLYFKQL
ncbi:hypothetical protein Noda2021_06600 [Candidatus Dependentiae bacterium Noda2021]|nr:hypothetical protein Noda2021_06600 [Candidatus Dependentiae bacterium Noda2021]